MRPDPAAAAVYADLRPVFIELYNALVPAFTSLRRLAPGLPIALRNFWRRDASADQYRQKCNARPDTARRSPDDDRSLLPPPRRLPAIPA